MSCMLCRKSGRIFNVYTNYGNANHNVRDDLVEFFGIDVEPYLDPGDCVCNVCMNMLDNVAKLKRRLWPIICRSSQETKVKLGKIWDIFASSKLEEEGSDEEPAIPCRTPTPSNLLVLNYSRLYNNPLENKIAERERLRSMSRASSGFGRSDRSETSEVRNILSRKRRKKKGHNWTRQKHGSRSSATSQFSSWSLPRRSKTRSPLSECSYASFYTIKRTPTKKRVVKYDEEGRIARKGTRSVSRAQENEARYLEMLESTRFYCNEGDCDLYFADVDVLNEHRTIDHEILPLHFCSECHKKYTISEHLKLHQKIHDTLPFLCLMCQCELKNQAALQEHLQEHLMYSVPCKYCDKSFLSKNIRDNHTKSAHGGSRERNVYKKKIILDQVDKEEASRISPYDNKKSDRLDYVVHLIPYTDMERDEGDLDVTTENLNASNIDISSYSDISTDDSEIFEIVPKRTISSDCVVLSPVESVEMDM